MLGSTPGKRSWYDTLDRPAVYPAFHVFAGLAPLSGATLHASQVTSTVVEALVLRDGARAVLWIANRTDSPMAIEIPPEVSASARIATVDADGFEAPTTTFDHLDWTARPLAAGL